ncbi:MAG: helix-turn-helix domain-containing protein [Clostridiales bacterium]|nr:helix-turn-helix domain-containing protein [Clostridiales bacterium]
MKNLCILNDALNYIEDHLREDFSQSDIAAYCCCSLSSLQKLFSYAFHIGVSDYVTRRRLTCCARELVKSDRSILDLALDWGYQSQEALTRAFARMWGEPPASFRKSRKFTGMFPKFEILDNENGGRIMRKYDITELYDLLSQARGTYMLAFDIQNLVPINEISRKAGDIAIRESMRRIEDAAGEKMLFFRIGGDEFALVTGLADEAEADAVAKKVTDRNGEPVDWEGRKIPLSLYSAKMKIEDKAIRYSELYPEIYNALISAKRQSE